jgi:3-deoxy-D-manno-octulosonate 8-phosphate phosphatase KdsC-like HAD superfamily phosphatase
VVSQALKHIVELLSVSNNDIVAENVKSIRSLAVHMMILAALQKHIQAQEIMEDAIVSLYESSYNWGDDTSDSAVLDSLRSAGAFDVVLSVMKVDVKNSVTGDLGL